jgi:transposase
MKDGCLQGNLINLPKFGKVKVIWHRPLPDGFKIQTASITKKADGYYVTLSLEDATVPTIKPDNAAINIKNSAKWAVSVSVPLNFVRESGRAFRS